MFDPVVMRSLAEHLDCPGTRPSHVACPDIMEFTPSRIDADEIDPRSLLVGVEVLQEALGTRVRLDLRCGSTTNDLQ